MTPSLEPTLEQLQAEITSLRITLAHREEVIIYYNTLFDFLTERALAGDRVEFTTYPIMHSNKVFCSLGEIRGISVYASTSQLALDSVMKLYAGASQS